jgi:hypothetical protein
MPEPLTLVPLEVGVGEAPLPGDRQHLAGEGLVELDQVDLGELDVGQRERLGGRRHRPDAHRLRRDAGHRPGHQPGQRAQPELGGLLRGGDHADRGAVVLPAGVAGGDGGLRVVLPHDRAQLRQGLHAGVGADVLVAVHDDLALPPLDRDRHDLLGEPALRGGRGGAPVAADGVLVLLLAADAYSRRRFSAVSSIPPGTGWFWPTAVTRPRARPSCSSTPGPALTPQRMAVE